MNMRSLSAANEREKTSADIGNVISAEYAIEREIIDALCF